MFSHHKQHHKHFHIHINRGAAVLLALAMVYVGAMAALYRLSTPERIQNKFKNFLHGTTRHITFDTKIQRRLFPRPTIVLTHVALTEANGKTPAISAEQIRIGIAWQSLLGAPVVEKLVVVQPHVQFVREANGRWNTADLWKKNQHGNLSFNRIEIENGELVVADTDIGSLKIDQINLQSSRNQQNLPYTLTANLHTPYWDNVSLQADGVAQWGKNSLQIPNVHLTFSGKENGYDFAGSLKTEMAWQGETFTLNNAHLDAQSRRYNSTLNMNIAQLQSHHGDTRIANISANIANDWGNITANLPLANWIKQQGNSENATLSAHLNQQNLDINLKTNARFVAQTGLLLTSTKIQTQQNHGSLNRFASEWEGAINATRWHEWQVSLQGLFDRQPATLALQQHGKTISGNLKLAKFSTQAYFSDNPLSGSMFTFPELPENWQIQSDIDIATIETPSLKIDNLHTTLNLNNKKLELSPLSADLYSGHSTGSFAMFNETPLRFQLQQNATNMQIRPLLQDIFAEDTISGKGNAQLNFKVSGNDEKSWAKSFSGSLKLDVKDGMWWGINFAKIGELISGSPNATTQLERQEYPFSHFVLDAKFQDGIGPHTFTANLTEPVAQARGEGQLNFVAKTINDKIVFSADGDHKPLPLKISGDWQKPSVSLDYQQITSGLKTPEQKQQAVSQTLKKQWQWLLQKKTE